MYAISSCVRSRYWRSNKRSTTRPWTGRSLMTASTCSAERTVAPGVSFFTTGTEELGSAIFFGLQVGGHVFADLLDCAAGVEISRYFDSNELGRIDPPLDGIGFVHIQAD